MREHALVNQVSLLKEIQFVLSSGLLQGTKYKPHFYKYNYAPEKQ